MSDKGYVYFVQNKSENIKIGFTVNLEQRLTVLNTANEYDLKLLGYIENCEKHFETYCHYLVDKFRINREWFSIESWFFFVKCTPFKPLLVIKERVKK